MTFGWGNELHIARVANTADGMGYCLASVHDDSER